MTPPGLLDHILAALLGVVLPLVAIAGGRRRAVLDAPFETADKIGLYWANAILLALAAAATAGVWLAQGRGLGNLGLAPPRPARLGEGLLLSAVIAAWYAVDTLLQVATPARRAEARARWLRRTPFMPSTRRELAHAMVLVAAAALCEEIVFRGFAISYLLWFFGSSLAGAVAAAAVPAAIFGLSHLYQGAGGAAKVAAAACAFGALFLVTGSLWLPISLHFAMNVASLLAGARLMKGA